MAADEGGKMSDSGLVLRRALADLRHSKGSTAKDSALDEIALLAAAGNDRAVRELVKIVFELRLAENPVRSVLLDPADVDDAVQATVIVVATKIESFERASSFKTWVGNVARNEALQVVRRRQRKTEPETNELPEHDQKTRRLSSLVADDDLYAYSFGLLSDKHQEVIRLREELELSYEEISERLEVPLGTVRSRLNQARTLLAESLVAADPDRSAHGGI